MGPLRDPVTMTSAFRHREKRRFASTAQMIEAIVMLFVVTCAIGVTCVLLAEAVNLVHESARTEDATRAAINAAEAFSADPAGQAQTRTDGDFTVTCDVTPEAHRDGTLYRARITVADAAGAQFYELDTARYVAAPDAAASPSDRTADTAPSSSQGGAA